jgi:hypothetical protein
MGPRFMVQKDVNQVNSPKCETIVYSKPPKDFLSPELKFFNHTLQLKTEMKDLWVTLNKTLHFK